MLRGMGGGEGEEGGADEVDKLLWMESILFWKKERKELQWSVVNELGMLSGGRGVC